MRICLASGLALSGILGAQCVVGAFSFSPRGSVVTNSCYKKSSSRPSLHELHLSNDDKPYSFDISRPTFDLFALRNIRGDALLQYNTLNQSEPLRINLYLLLTLSLFAFPSISEAVLGEDLTLPGTVASAVGGIGSFALFLRECGRRSKQLDRIEKEMNAEFLRLRVPTNRLAERRFGKTVQLKELRGVKRIIALSGTKDQLRDAMVQVRVFRRRLVQAAAIVVAVPTDGSRTSDWDLRDEEMRSVPFLAEAEDVDGWLDYFRNLQNKDDGTVDGSPSQKLVWFGLNNNGRSFASGAGDPPRLVEVLGQNLRPLEVLDEEDEAEKGSTADEARSVSIDAVLNAQKTFYAALTNGNLSTMESILAVDGATEVSEVLSGGGRVDNWKACLEDGARPSGMQISGSDVLIVSQDEAYSTAIEFPANTGIDSATLLAVQQWKNVDDEWKLQLHQTIPWSPDSKAGGTLRCDCRGCVALTRAKDRRTFGGLVGR